MATLCLKLYNIYCHVRTYIFIFLLLCLSLLRYPLSGGEASFSPADNLFTTLRVTLAAPDVVAIRNDSGIATVRSDTFLALSLGAVADFSGNLLDVATSPVIMAARYVCMQYEILLC